MNSAQAFLEGIPFAWVILGAVGGFFLARKFPGIFPMQVSNNDILSRLDALEGKLKQ